uniref:(northern house mosquito) hypothetical protein n=1 Tax=Culex pipiens TaxID=7175 RepID=A0A8D8B3P6_CULPI
MIVSHDLTRTDVQVSLDIIRNKLKLALLGMLGRLGCTSRRPDAAHEGRVDGKHLLVERVRRLGRLVFLDCHRTAEHPEVRKRRDPFQKFLPEFVVLWQIFLAVEHTLDPFPLELVLLDGIFSPRNRPGAAPAQTTRRRPREGEFRQGVGIVIIVIAATITIFIHRT